MIQEGCVVFVCLFEESVAAFPPLTSVVLLGKAFASEVELSGDETMGGHAVIAYKALHNTELHVKPYTIRTCI